MSVTLALNDGFELREYIRPGDTVLWGQATGEPAVLTSRLFEQRHAIGGFRCFLGMSLPTSPARPLDDGIQFGSYCALGSNRLLAEAQALDVLPSHYSHLPELFRSRRFPIDVVLLLLPAADDDGTHAMGLADEYLSAAIEGARTLIAEVNPNVPRTSGTNRIRASDLDLVVESSRPVLQAPPVQPSNVERVIAKRVAQLVPDGATLQFGLGSLPVAILSSLTEHRDLGVHSGMVNDGVADLMQDGVITNSRKPIDRGITVTGLLMGTERLNAFAHQNPRVAVRDTGYTHDPTVLACLPAFVAINSAVEVDLTGAVNAEAIGRRYVGAVGGAADFLRGAHRSKGGLPIIALPATAGTSSRIVARIDGPVSTARSDVGLVVSEHGVADLRGVTLDRRIELMLDIAAPEHRHRLAAEAESLLSNGGL